MESSHVLGMDEDNPSRSFQSQDLQLVPSESGSQVKETTEAGLTTPQVQQTTNLQENRYRSLDPSESEQIVRLTRDLTSQITAYNALHETLVTSSSLQESLVKENASLRQSLGEYQEIVEKEKKQIRDLTEKLRMSATSNEADQEGRDQESLLSEEDATSAKVQKRVISSLVRVIGNLVANDISPDRVKQSIVDIVRRTSGRKEGDAFAACLEGNTSDTEEELVNSMCDWIEGARMDLNQQDGYEEVGADVVEPSTRQARMEEEVNDEVGRGGGAGTSVNFDQALYDLVAEIVSIPFKDLLKNQRLLQYPFLHSTLEIATAVFVAIVITEESDIQKGMVIEASLTECPLAPRFASLIAFMRYVTRTYPEQHQSLASEFCRVFCRKVAEQDDADFMKNEKINEQIGRFFGVMFQVLEAVDIETVVITIGGVKRPYLYSFLHGMLCNNSAGVFNYINGVTQWVDMDLWVRAVLLSIMGGPSFTDSKFRNSVINALLDSGIASVIPVHLSYECSLLGMITEISKIQSEIGLMKGGRIIAMMLVQLGWDWVNEYATGVISDYEKLWKTKTISEVAFGETILKGIGTAVFWMRKKNITDAVNLNTLKQLINKYQGAQYPNSVQLAASSAITSMEQAKPHSEETGHDLWIYEKTDGDASQNLCDTAFLKDVEDLFFSQEEMKTASQAAASSSPMMLRGLDLSYQESRVTQLPLRVPRPVPTRHSIVEDPPSTGKSMYLCSCNKYFKKLQNLARHVQAENEKIFKCELCTKSFSSHFLLDTHVGNDHPGHQYVHMYFCSRCGEQYATSNELISHLTSHEQP